MQQEAGFDLSNVIVAPPTPKAADVVSGVRPDAMRVIFSPLVNITVNQKRQIPFGCLGTIPLTEEWLPARDVPVTARHRISPDPNDPATWHSVQPGKLPVPQLASVIVNSDTALARVLKDYSDMGCREVEALREKTVEQILSIQQRLFGGEQMRTHEQIRQRVLLVAENGKDDKTLIATAREVMRVADQALEACKLYWKARRVEMASDDKFVVKHADNFDLRCCEFADIDPVSTEADALRADVLRNQAAAAPAPVPAVDWQEVGKGFAVGLKESGLVVTAAAAKPEEAKPTQQNKR